MPFKKSDLTFCPNCGEAYTEDANFCHHCGQINRELNLPVKHWIIEFLDTFFNIDSRFFKAVKLMITQPGALTLAFFSGQRVQYVPPFRLYLITSILFFLVQSMQFTQKDAEKSMKQIEKALADTTEFNANILGSTFKTTSKEIKQIKDLPNEQLDSFMQAKKIPVTFLNRASLRGTSRLLAGEIHQYNQSLLQNFSKLMFFLMPVFGFLTWLFFKKTTPFYTQHLVFSIHYHTAIFIALIFYTPISFLIFKETSTLAWIPLLISISYLAISIKKVFAISWKKAIGNTFLISLIYFFILATGFTLAAIVSILFMA